MELEWRSKGETMPSIFLVLSAGNAKQKGAEPNSFHSCFAGLAFDPCWGTVPSPDGPDYVQLIAAVIIRQDFARGGMDAVGKDSKDLLRTVNIHGTPPENHGGWTMQASAIID